MWSGRRSGSAGHCSDPFPQECSYKRFATGLIGKWKAEIGCRESPGQALGAHFNSLWLKGSSIHHAFVLKEVERSIFSPFRRWTVWRIIIRAAWML